jgi:pimeloyl-ACP methyl ester carboxylesterase
MNRLCLLLSLLLTASSGGLAGEIPDVLRTAGGRSVETREAWESVRRPEVLELFRTHVYGRNPVGRPDSLRFETADAGTAMMEGMALRKKIVIRYSGPGGAGAIRLTAFIPRSGKPAPAFLLICNRPEKNIDPERIEKSPFWPAEELVARGYAALAFFNGDVDPDRHDGFTNGVHGVFQPDASARKPDAWATIAAWAWGASRVMDWIETEPLLDARRVAVVGHSRGGKTALWCGATDPRFALTISNDSGCGGAKLNRMDLPKSESIARINQALPHWFCENFKQYGSNEDALPVDQHMLIALLAPRLAYVASATLDDWAGQPGEFRSCQLASPVWQLYGLKGLVGDAFPPPDAPRQEGRVGYHLRTGKHDLTVYDWQRFMDFADKHWKQGAL